MVSLETYFASIFILTTLPELITFSLSIITFSLSRTTVEVSHGAAGEHMGPGPFHWVFGPKFAHYSHLEFQVQTDDGKWVIVTACILPYSPIL
jgi:hypothetical protein